MLKKINNIMFLGLITISLPIYNLTSCSRNFSVVINNYDLSEIESCKNKDIATYNTEYILELKFKQGYTLDLSKYSVMCISDVITDKCNYDVNIGELIIPKQFVIGYIVINIVACERIINLTWNVDNQINIKNQQSSIKYIDYLENNFVISLPGSNVDQLTWSILDAKYQSELGSDGDEETCSWLKETKTGATLTVPHIYLKWNLIINIRKKEKK